MKFTPCLSVSAFALMIGLAWPVLSYAETVTYDLPEDTPQAAGAVRTSDSQDDRSYEAPQNEEGHKRLYVDHSGKIVPMLSSDGPSDEPATQAKDYSAEEDEADSQPVKKSVVHKTKSAVATVPSKSNAATVSEIVKPPESAKPKQALEVHHATIARPTTDTASVSATNADPSTKKQKHEASFVPVSDSILKARGNGAMAQAEKESRIRLEHIKLFHHRISRTEAAKMADSAADTEQGVGAAVQ